jgi:hypothetical protein
VDWAFSDGCCLAPTTLRKSNYVNLELTAIGSLLSDRENCLKKYRTPCVQCQFKNSEFKVFSSPMPFPNMLVKDNTSG